MTQLIERVQQTFAESIETIISAADSLSATISQASERIVQCLLADRKILACGNGCSASDAMLFASKMLNRFDTDRPALPAVALTSDSVTLTSIANDDHYDQVFAKQISALGQAGDLLLAITTSGNSSNLIKACEAAHERDMDVVALMGADGGVLINHFGPEDIVLQAPSEVAARIHEVHLVILHSLCDLIDNRLFGDI